MGVKLKNQALWYFAEGLFVLKKMILKDL